MFNKNLLYILILILLIVPFRLVGQDSVKNQEAQLLEDVKKQDRKAKIETYINLAILLRDNKKALTYIDKAETEAVKEKSTQYIAEAKLMRVRYFFNNFLTDSFAKYADETKKFLVSNNDDRQIDIDIMKIRILIRQGMNEIALRSAQSLLEIYDTDNRSAYLKSRAYLAIGMVYAAGKHYANAISAFKECYEITQDSKLKLDVCLDLISNTYNIKDYSNSLHYCELAKQNFENYINRSRTKTQDIKQLGYIKLYIYCCFVMNNSKLGYLDKADVYLHKAAGYIDPYDGVDNQFYNQAAAIYYNSKGEYIKALSYVNILENVFLHEEMIPDYLEALQIKTDILANMDRYKDAYDTLKSLNTKQDSINSSQLNAQLSEFYTIYKLGKLEKEMSRQQSRFILICTISIFLVVIVCIYILYSQNLNRKNNALYRQMQDNMNNQSRQIISIQNISGKEMSQEKGLYIKICELMNNEDVYTDISFSRQTMAARLNTNDRYLANAIRDGADTTVANFISGYRLYYAVRLLASNPEVSVEEVSQRSGHGSYSAFLRAFSKKYGMSPSEYRKLVLKEKNIGEGAI